MIESEFGATIGAPGEFVVSGVCGAFFAVADGLDTGGIDPAFGEGVADGLCAEFAEGDIEFVRTAFIAVSFHHQDDGRIGGEKLRHGIEFAGFHGRNDGLAEIEVERRDIGGGRNGGKVIEPIAGEGSVADAIQVVVRSNEVAASNGVVETGIIGFGATATCGKEEAESEGREKKCIGFHFG